MAADAVVDNVAGVVIVELANELAPLTDSNNDKKASKNGIFDNDCKPFEAVFAKDHRVGGRATRGCEGKGVVGYRSTFLQRLHRSGLRLKIVGAQ